MRRTIDEVIAPGANSGSCRRLVKPRSNLAKVSTGPMRLHGLLSVPPCPIRLSNLGGGPSSSQSIAFAGPTKPKASTSRPKITEPHREPLPAAPPSSLEKKQVQWQQTVSEWFSQFAEEDDPNKMGGEGIEKLFEQMNVSMEGVSHRVAPPCQKFSSK